MTTENAAEAPAPLGPESYGYYPPSDEYPEDDGEEDWDSDNVSDNIERWAEPYDPAKHDGKRCSGGSFMDDIARNEARYS